MTTKSIRYLYDIEYIKHYNYYEDVDDDRVEPTYDRNHNYYQMESKDLESVENFSSEEEDKEIMMITRGFS